MERGARGGKVIVHFTTVYRPRTVSSIPIDSIQNSSKLTLEDKAHLQSYIDTHLGEWKRTYVSWREGFDQWNGEEHKLPENGILGKRAHPEEEEKRPSR